MNYLGWFLVGLIIAIVLIVLKIVNKKQAIAVKIVIFLFLFFALTIGYAVIGRNADLTTLDGVLHAGKVYFSWLGSVFKNMAKISSYAFHQDWGLNLTNYTSP